MTQGPDVVVARRGIGEDAGPLRCTIEPVGGLPDRVDGEGAVEDFIQVDDDQVIEIDGRRTANLVQAGVAGMGDARGALRHGGLENPEVEDPTFARRRQPNL